MTEKARVLGGYLSELRRAKKDKPEQVVEALEIYIRLWETVIKKGLVKPEDDVGDALRKVDQNGGLYRAAEG
ncbi:MAG: hypothetical protein ABSF83_11745 [Nitrososphaerales archaeon]